MKTAFPCRKAGADEREEEHVCSGRDRALRLRSLKMLGSCDSASEQTPNGRWRLGRTGPSDRSGDLRVKP